LYNFVYIKATRSPAARYRANMLSVLSTM